MIAADMLEKVAPASPLLPLLPALALPDIIFSWTEVLVNYLLAANRLFHGRHFVLIDRVCQRLSALRSQKIANAGSVT